MGEVLRLPGKQVKVQCSKHRELGRHNVRDEDVQLVAQGPEERPEPRVLGVVGFGSEQQAGGARQPPVRLVHQVAQAELLEEDKGLGGGRKLQSNGFRDSN